jgi:hypothetical protein
MRLELGKVVYVGEVAVAAVAIRSVHCSDCFHALSFHCTKRPVAILIRYGDVTMPFDIDGSRIDLHDFEQRYPGQRATFEQICGASKCADGK